MNTFFRILLIANLTSWAGAVSERAFLFDHDKPGAAPAGLESDGDTWRVVPERLAVSAPNIVLPPRSALSGGQASLLLVKDLTVVDADMGFRFRVLQEDRAAMVGMIWRFVDPDNFYSVQMDIGSESVALIRRVKGKTKVIRSEGIVLTSPVWHSFLVRTDGRQISVVYDDSVVIQATDKTLTKPGQLGLQASPGDTVQIDDFAFRPHGEINPK